MAASMSVCAPALSQKKRRAILKKERRKRKRQALAQARECGVGDGENRTPEEEDDDENPDEERQQLHNEWLERERLAQEEFQLISEREEAARKRQEEDERRIKEEWEAQQVKEQEAKDQKLQERRNREEAVQKMLDRAESELENGRPWMNPEAPVGENSVNYGTERDIANCPFFLKTGACRFGDRCSRKHVHPASTPTLMIRGMFVTFGMEQSRRDDYDTDSCLEHSEEELHEHFLEFYQDVLPEFQGLGKVVQFKVSCNFEPHLRGNVYIQFDTEEQCRDAFMKFNGRWYAGRQLHCELCPVTRWKNAICGLFDKRKCPKGKHCNFLHVFRNPGNEFWEADRDLHLSPDRVGEGSHRGGWRSERQGERSWRGQRCGSSRSPPRSERSYGRRGSERRRRSRSGERRGGGFQGDDRRMSRRRDGRRSRSRERGRSRSRSRERGRSRSRSRERGRSRSRSRNRERERSSSRDRERDRLRNGSRDKDRERGKSRSRERDRSQGRSGARETGSVVGVKRERSRSVSRDGEEKRRQRDRTGKRSPRGDGGDGDDHTPRHHKHSKKSKKKSKKKHKKKKKSHSLPEAVTSSGESEGDGEEEREDDLSAIGPSNDVKDAQLVQTEGEVFDSYSEAASQNATVRDLQGNAQGTPLEMSCKLEGDSLT